MYRRLMVPLDGTVDSQHAIPFALSIAAREDAVVELVHVAIPPSVAAQMGSAGMELYGSLGVDPETAQEIHSQSERQLEQLAAKASGSGHVRIESTVLDRSDVAHAISEYALQSNPDLLVMTKHDHSRLERLVLGSVSESVVRRVNVPVLLVPAAPTPPSLAHRVSIDHVLVPIDGSPLADTVIPHARAIAEAMDARLTLFTVNEEEMLPPPPGLAAFEYVEPTASEASALLKRAAAEFRASGVPVETATSIARDRGAAILEFAESHAVDLIAMSTHGRRGIGRLVAGSVASGVLHHATVPVMLYRPEQQS